MTRSSIKLKIDAVGFDDVQKMLGELAPREAKNILRATVGAIARNMRREVRAAAPVGKTGNLKKSITSTRDRGTPTSIEASLKIKRPLGSHWHLLEYGTVRMAPRSFTRPAMERARRAAPAVFRREFFIKLEKALTRRANKVPR